MKKLMTICIKKNEKNRRIRMWKAFCRIVVLAFLSSGYAAQATTFDVATDFSATNNPNGVWSYGWSSTLTSAFNLYPNHGKFDPMIPIDVWAGSNFPYSPQVSHNGTGSPVTSHPTIIWQPGQFSLHPGDSGEYSHALWTAPYAGSIDIAAVFTGIDHGGTSPFLGTTTDVHVLHNGISLFDGSVNGYGNTSSFSTTVSVGIGDIIDFTVGYGSNQNHTCDSTALSATIFFIPESACSFSDDFEGTTLDTSLWSVFVDALGQYHWPYVADGLLHSQGYHTRIDSIPTFAAPETGQSVVARARIRLAGELHKFGFAVNPNERTGPITGYYFDTVDVEGREHYIRALAWRQPAVGSQINLLDVEIPVTWYEFHEFAIERTPSEVIYSIDGQEVARVADAFAGALPVGVWNDRWSLMQTDWVGVNCEPEPEWSFVHMTDTHIGWPGAEDKLAAAIDDVSSMNPQPDLVIISGDLVDLDLKPFYKWYLDAIDSIKNKVYAVPGNHDRLLRGNLVLYNTYVNSARPSGTTPFNDPNNYYFDHNEVLFVGLDSGGGYPTGDGLTEDQNEALWNLFDEDTSKVIFMHHPVIDVNNKHVIENYRDEFITYCEEKNVQIVLTGHTHEDHTFDVNGVKYIQTPAITDPWGEGDPTGYRVIDVQGGLVHPRPCTVIDIQQRSKITGVIHSAANLHIYDFLGRHVGIIDANEAERGIPHSFYFGHYIDDTNDTNEILPEKIIIFDPCDDYRYEVVGTETGTYRLEIGFGEDGNETTFEANDIPTLPGSVHTYTIDWDMLAQDQNGVTVTVDIDGDGIPEKTIISDDELISEEFDRPPVANAGGPYVAQATSWSGASVGLDGAGSSDPDGDTITYQWDLDLAVDSDSDGVPNNDVDATEPTLTRLFPIGQTEISLVVTDEYGVRSQTDVATVTVSFIQVGIDIKPGSFPNAINLGSHGVIPVAFLTDEVFDASTIDPTTVTLRGEDFSDGMVKLRGKKDAPVPMSNLKDVDGDGDLDLVVHLETEKLAEYELEAICEIGALTFDGYVVSGSDTIKVVPQ